MLLSTKRSSMASVWAAAFLALLLLPIPLECLAAPGASSKPHDPLHFSLVRKRAPQRGPHDYLRMANHVRQKYGKSPVNSTTTTTTQQKRSGQLASVNVLNQNADSTYIAQMTAGTPPQTFDVVLDTGSSDLWFAGTSCASCPSGSNTFDATKSSSFQNQQSTVTISYGSGNVQGTLVQDTVGLGGFSVTNQAFVVVSQTSSDFIEAPVSGLLGLAFKALAQSKATPFMEFLSDNNQLSTPEMSFWLRRDGGLTTTQVDASTPQPGGVFTIGGTNSSLYTGSIDFVNLPSSSTPSFWFLPVNVVTVRGSQVSIPTGNSALAAIDSGTSLIGGPSSAVKNIYAAIPGSQALSGNMVGYYSYPCSSSIDLTFNFGSKTWPVNDADFNVGQLDSKGDCLGAVFDLDAGTTSSPSDSGSVPSWVIGDTFLKNVYSVFRFSPASVGFAQLSSLAVNSDAPGSGQATITGASNPLPSISAAFRTVDRPSFGSIVALVVIFTALSTLAL